MIMLNSKMGVGCVNYREEQEKTRIYKEKYVSDIENLIAKRQKDAEDIRKEYFKDIFANQEKYRNDFKAMLGWPLAGYKSEGIPNVVSELLSKEDGYDIYRMQFEACRCSLPCFRRYRK